MQEEVKQLLTKPWQKFFARFDEIDTLKVSQWKDVHVLAYMCKRYREQYGTDYSVAIKGSPLKSPDIFFTKKMIAQIGTTNMKVVKEYIDWVWDKKVIPKEMNLRSFGFFMTGGLVNEFKLSRKKSEKIVRATVLPSEYRDILSSYDIEADTYGDLAFVKLFADKQGKDSYLKAFKSLQIAGLDLGQLENITE